MAFTIRVRVTDPIKLLTHTYCSAIVGCTSSRKLLQTRRLLQQSYLHYTLVNDACNSQVFSGKLGPCA